MMPIPVLVTFLGAVSGLSVPLDIAIKNYSPTHCTSTRMFHPASYLLSFNPQGENLTTSLKK